MKAIDLLVGFNSVKDSYVISAEEFRQGKRKRLSKRMMWLIAAVIALTLLLVGCAVAYANGWFQLNPRRLVGGNPTLETALLAQHLCFSPCGLPRLVPLTGQVVTAYCPPGSGPEECIR